MIHQTLSRRCFARPQRHQRRVHLRAVGRVLFVRRAELRRRLRQGLGYRQRRHLPVHPRASSPHLRPLRVDLVRWSRGRSLRGATSRAARLSPTNPACGLQGSRRGRVCAPRRTRYRRSVRLRRRQAVIWPRGRGLQLARCLPKRRRCWRGLRLRPGGSLHHRLPSRRAGRWDRHEQIPVDPWRSRCRPLRWRRSTRRRLE